MGKHQRTQPLSRYEICNQLRSRSGLLNGKKMNLLKFYDELKYVGKFKNEHFNHTIQQFHQRVYKYNGKIDFNQTSLCTIKNNLQDEDQVYNIVHSLPDTKNIICAVTTDEQKICKTIMTDMCEDSINGVKIKLAAEFLESECKMNVGRSIEDIEKTKYDSPENYRTALTTLGFPDLSPDAVYKEYERLKKEPKSKHIRDVCQKNHKAQK